MSVVLTYAMPELSQPPSALQPAVREELIPLKKLLFAIRVRIGPERRLTWNSKAFGCSRPRLHINQALPTLVNDHEEAYVRV
jgi:hypothetical protein